jgi:hypothetical protein
MLRKNSTQTLPIRAATGLSGSVRIVPTTEPTSSATTSESAATITVWPQACSSQSR